MRKLFYTIAIAAFAAISLQAQSLDQILNDHFKATGQEKLTKIKSRVTTGKITYVTAGLESAISMYQARPNKLRMEASMMGTKVIQTYNGTTGWLYAPGMGLTVPQEMGPDEVKAILPQAAFDSPLWNYKEKGNTLELAGSSKDGSAHLVTLTQTDGETMTVMLDKKSFLIAGFSMVQMLQGVETEVEVSMKNYKPVKGIQTAHYVSTKVNGDPMITMAIESIEFDKDLDPAMFEKPVTE